MSDLQLIVFFLFTVALAGVVGTAGMTFVAGLVARLGKEEISLLETIGSLFTGTLQSARLVGSIFHLLAGVLFAILYTLLFSFFSFQGVGLLTAVGAVMGFAHGFIVSFLLVTSVGEHHPIDRYRKCGFYVAFAYVLGHVVFGALVGFVVGLMGFTLQQS